MWCEAFVGFHDFDDGNETQQPVARNLLKGNFPDKAVEIHTTICACIAAGGQRVVGTRGIVAGALGRIGSEKYRAGIAYPPGPLGIDYTLNNEMHGSIEIDHVAQLAFSPPQHNVTGRQRLLSL